MSAASGNGWSGKPARRSGSSGGVWTQQGDKLVGAGAVIGGAGQGWSVSLSDDGNTAIVGGPADNGSTGAAWVFTRSGGVWTQQGDKLVGTGAEGFAFQGVSVALSGDGNTAVVGGSNDNSVFGAAWVFTRSGGVWTQQGDKLVGTGPVGPSPPRQGTSVSLSDDGNTAIVGGIADNNDVGAAWLFTRSSGVWSQQAKLVGTGALPPSKALLSHSPVTGIPPWWAVLMTILKSAQLGYSPRSPGRPEQQPASAKVSRR